MVFWKSLSTVIFRIQSRASQVYRCRFQYNICHSIEVLSNWNIYHNIAITPNHGFVAATCCANLTIITIGVCNPSSIAHQDVELLASIHYMQCHVISHLKEDHGLPLSIIPTSLKLQSKNISDQRMQLLNRDGIAELVSKNLCKYLHDDLQSLSNSYFSCILTQQIHFPRLSVEMAMYIAVKRIQ